MAPSRAPRAAVIIPCHNDGRFVSEAVASVTEQGLWELVVVDDGSEDPETLSVLADLAEKGTRVLRQRNQGLSGARMTGVEAVDVPYVIPLDADDRLAPGALTTQADALDANPHVNATWGDFRTFGIRDCLIPQAPRLDPWRITYINELPGGGPMVRRNALLELGGWDMGSGYEDWDFWMKAAERGWCGMHVGRVTVLHREHADRRMYAASRARHGELRATLRTRHAGLFAARRRNWRRSPSGSWIRFLFPLVGLLPGVPEVYKEHLWVLVRNAAEPELRPECFLGLVARLRRQLRLRLAGRANGRRESPAAPR